MRQLRFPSFRFVRICVDKVWSTLVRPPVFTTTFLHFAPVCSCPATRPLLKIAKERGTGSLLDEGSASTEKT
jgi:hypothetical protein